jgi:putative tryptophan/tyrosine transport system ATP-binding protein
MIRVENVSLCFPSADRPILQAVNYAIEEGDRVILLGGNGSGKSSLLKLLNRTYTPTTGQIWLRRHNLQTVSVRSLSQKIVTVTQDLRDSLFFNLTVLENCLLWETRFQNISFKLGKQREKQFYAEYLADFHGRLPKKLDICVAALSGGERQSLVLALCLLHPPELLLLDEHTSALDPKTAAHLIRYTEKLLTEKSITCVLATHNLSIALKYGNRLLALSEGQIRLQADGPDKAQLSEDQVLERCYGDFR